jgi:hypothetical protein
LIISIFKKIPLQNHGYKNTIFYSCPCVRAGKVFNKNEVEIVDKQGCMDVFWHQQNIYINPLTV